MKMQYNKVLADLKSFASEDRRKVTESFFKTKKGEYSYGDIFLGVSMPNQRIVAKKYLKTTLYEANDLNEFKKLMLSEFHDARSCGILILVSLYQKSKTTEDKKQYIEFYLSNLKGVNNWDLVDSSAYKLLGDYALKDPSYTEIINTLSSSKELWQERIAIVSTLAFIKKREFSLIIKLALDHISHPHDLIQKAVGWMLREMGKQDELTLINFLKEHHSKMPRTMYRYSVEKLSDKVKKEINNI